MCFRNSEMLRKPDGSTFLCVSARRFRREKCKMKMEALFRVSVTCDQAIFFPPFFLAAGKKKNRLIAG